MKNIDMKFYVCLASLLLFLDRLTKHFVMYYVPHYEIHPSVHIDLVFNRGISFGLFHSHNAMIFMAVNAAICGVIIALVVHTYFRMTQNKLVVGEIFIFAGAISNMIDRYLYSGVVDFIALSYKDWHFAVFNVADSFIFCGVMIMLILEYRESCKKS